MTIARVVRRWTMQDMCDAATRARFEQLMVEASRKSRGSPPLVDSWDDGGGTSPWYSACAGSDEKALRDRCVAMFGVECDRDDLVVRRSL